MPDVEHDVELVARSSYGRLLAWLTSRSGSVAMAEDALADALAVAVERWPDDGVPDNPEAWLLTVARRRLIDEQRRLDRRDDLEAKLQNEHRIRLNLDAYEATEANLSPGLPERRLELLFVCAHPDIPEAQRTPLMLQTVLGLTAEQIGSAMLVAPTTVGQRLVRVKRRIVEREIPFAVPPPAELPDRLDHVLDAIYAAYGLGWDAADDPSVAAHGLVGEAIWLAGLLVQLLPESGEAKGLYALLCLCESRRPARRADDGSFVPLEEQDTSRWNHELLLSGEIALWRAADHRELGRFQLEAAIHSHHADRARSGRTDWDAIRGAYGVLVKSFPTLGSKVGYAAAIGRTGEPTIGLEVLDELAADATVRHQPYWAVRAWLLREADHRQEAAAAYDLAIGLTVDPAVRNWLIGQREAL